MFAKTHTSAIDGIDGVTVAVEATLQNSLPKIQITGLAGDIVRESGERVRACLVNLGFDVPSGKVLVHLSPAGLRKQGSQCDLAIALAVLVAERILPAESVATRAFLGELSLDGRLHHVAGAVAMLQALERNPAVTEIFLPAANRADAALVGGDKVRIVESFSALVDVLRGERRAERAGAVAEMTAEVGPTLDVVAGQAIGKRALEIALAGRHHLLLVGPPGVGKSLLAACAPRLLPPLSREERVEVSKNYFRTGHPRAACATRPFRSPHHSLPAAALLGGGGGMISPGEISLAHAGVLFLDEFPEFRRDAIEGLREPMEAGKVFLNRVGHSVCLPARFTLVAAMNPCPCGYSLGGARACRCAREVVRRYRRRISGPVLDRLDLCAVLMPPTGGPEPVHAGARSRIEAAGRAQAARLAGTAYRRNGDLRQEEADISALVVGAEEKLWLERKKAAGTASFRALHKCVRVARTIADLAGEKEIRLADLNEAWGLRCPENFFD